jgi:hypothetical protein
LRIVWRKSTIDFQLFIWLQKGFDSSIGECKNQNGVTALREIAAGRVSVKDEKAKKK